MTFFPGKSGNPAGRPKKTRFNIDETLAQEGKNPLKELLLLLPELSPNKQADVWLDLLSYLCPKPKEIQLSDEDLKRLEISRMSDQELLDLAREKIPELREKKVG